MLKYAVHILLLLIGGSFFSQSLFANDGCEILAKLSPNQMKAISEYQKASLWQRLLLQKRYLERLHGTSLVTQAEIENYGSAMDNAAIALLKAFNVPFHTRRLKSGIKITLEPHLHTNLGTWMDGIHREYGVSVSLLPASKLISTTDGAAYNASRNALAISSEALAKFPRGSKKPASLLTPTAIEEHEQVHLSLDGNLQKGRPSLLGSLLFYPESQKIHPYENEVYLEEFLAYLREANAESIPLINLIEASKRRNQPIDPSELNKLLKVIPRMEKRYGFKRVQLFKSIQQQLVNHHHLLTSFETLGNASMNSEELEGWTVLTNKNAPGSVVIKIFETNGIKYGIAQLSLKESKSKHHMQLVLPDPYYVDLLDRAGNQMDIIKSLKKDLVKLQMYAAQVTQVYEEMAELQARLRRVLRESPSDQPTIMGLSELLLANYRRANQVAENGLNFDRP